MEQQIPDKNDILPTPYKTSCFIKNTVKARNILIGDYTYYDDPLAPTEFENNNVLFNYPEFGDKLIIGKFCAIASGTQFLMGAANHRLNSVSTYPFHVFGKAWAENTPIHLKELPHKGNTVVGNDVWFGRDCFIMPGVKIGDGAIIGAKSVVAKDVPPYAVVCGNPARVVKMRFDSELIAMLLQLKWWDFDEEKLLTFLPLLCSSDTQHVKNTIKDILAQ